MNKPSTNVESNEQISPPKLLNIVYGPHSTLKTKSAPVEDHEFGEALDNFTKLMQITMASLSGAGLAAVQVGLLKRMFVANIKGNEIVMVNPEIIDSSEEMVATQEGCLSLPLYRFGATRHKTITVKFQDTFGNELEEAYSDEEAVVIQHEMEHLDGITLLDKVSRLKQDIYKRKFKKLKKRMSRKPLGG
jgi:peptide deformylase